MKNSSHTASSQERGVVLIISVFFVFVCVAAVAYFLYAVPINKTTSVQLRQRISRLCSSIASSPMTYEEATTAFFTGVSNIEPRYGEITKAVLYLPGMDDFMDNNGDIYQPDAYSSDLKNSLGSPPSLPGNVENPAIARCDGSGGPIDCRIVRDFGWDGGITLGSPPDPTVYNAAYVSVPKSLGLHTYYAGNMIGCEVWGRVTRNIMANLFEKQVNDSFARVFYVRKPKFHNEGPAGFDPGAASGRVATDLPKVTFVLDPYFQTKDPPQMQALQHLMRIAGWRSLLVSGIHIETSPSGW